MSNGIYDILGKLNGLKPKDNPVSMSAEPVYESVDTHGDIMTAVNSLEVKYIEYKKLIEARSQQKDAEISRGEPELVKLLNKARLERPSAASDTEALAYQMVKANKELEKANAANDEQETKIADLQAKVGTVPAPVAQAPVVQPTAKIPQTQPAPTAPAQKSAALINFPTTTPQPVPQAEPEYQSTPQGAQQADQLDQPVPQAEPVVTTKSARTYKPATAKKSAVGTEVPTSDPLASVAPQELPPNVIPIGKGKKAAEPEIDTSFDPGLVLAPDEDQLDVSDAEKEIKRIQQGSKEKEREKLAVESKNKSKNMLRENIEMLTEYREGDPQLALFNWNTLINAWKKRQPKVDLDFAGKSLTIWKEQMYGILSEFATDQNAERRMQRVEDVLSSHDATVQFMMLPRVKKFINQYPQFEKNDPTLKAAKAKQKELAKTGQADMFSGDSKLPVGSRNEMQENLGNDTMQENVKTSSILKAVHQVEDKKLRESAKPDFLDLDKDGDTDEPMKSAAKSAKNDEPADVDSDAVAKRKRLQALKDKQEDERAEKGDYDSKSSTRVVKGRAYGGAAQKDDEDKDELEEGKFKEIYTDMMDYATKKGYSSHKQFTPADYDALAKPHGISGKELAVALGHKKASQVAEVAPPGAKAERMVKHVKKGYAKDGKLSKREKGIAYATAWKAHNKGQVEEGTNFGDTIKNSEGKMTKVKVTEGKDAIRNHPIYTTKEAWDHYSQELAEQEAMDQEVMEAPVVDVQQELDEIAKLAGLAPKMESKCSSCGCADCKCTTLEEAATRKDFRQAADTIKDIEDLEKRKEHAHHYADFFKEQNPRFKREMFLAACGLDECDYNMGAQPATIIVGETNGCPVCNEDPCMCDREREMGEGNEFTKARLDAIAQGSDTFTVGGKTYNVSGDTSDEKTQVESVGDDEKQAVTEDINVSITANGEQDALNLLRKLSGMSEVPQVTSVAIPMEEEAVEEERDIELANTPHETVAPINAVTVDAGGGLGGPKKQYPLAANRGANPLEEEKLWTAYESMINDVKA